MAKISPDDYAKLGPNEKCKLVAKIMGMRWSQISRPEQVPFDNQDTRTAVFMGGRGSGKTRSAAEWMAQECLNRPGLKAAILSPTYTSGWDTCLHGAKSGLLTLIPDKSLFTAREKKYTVEFINGSSIRVFSSENPTHMRGPEFHILWIDEMADLSHGMKCWKIIKPAIRLPSEKPALTYVTGTPEAKELVTFLVDKAEDDDAYDLKTGSTAANEANLDPDWLDDLYSTWEGTRYHKEQLEGVLLREAANALWSVETINKIQRKYHPEVEFDLLAFGIDPAVSSDKKADETGLIVGGRFIDNYGLTRHPGKTCAAILGDYSRRASPLQWFRDLVRFSEEHGVTTWVYERNLAGPLIRDVGQKVLDEADSAIRLIPVQARGTKLNRADPVAALYEAERVIHMPVPGLSLDKLESQMTQWEPTDRDSPDRIDALVHLIKFLLFKGGKVDILRSGAMPWSKK